MATKDLTGEARAKRDASERGRCERRRRVDRAIRSRGGARRKLDPAIQGRCGGREGFDPAIRGRGDPRRRFGVTKFVTRDCRRAVVEVLRVINFGRGEFGSTVRAGSECREEFGSPQRAIAERRPSSGTASRRAGVGVPRAPCCALRSCCYPRPRAAPGAFRRSRGSSPFSSAVPPASATSHRSKRAPWRARLAPLAGKAARPARAGPQGHRRPAARLAPRARWART